MDGSIDWFGTAALVTAIGALLWAAARSRLPRVVRMVPVAALGLLLAVVDWNTVVVLMMPPR
jgi:hypothetical protein